MLMYQYGRTVLLRSKPNAQREARSRMIAARNGGGLAKGTRYEDIENIMNISCPVSQIKPLKSVAIDLNMHLRGTRYVITTYKLAPTIDSFLNLTNFLIPPNFQSPRGASAGRSEDEDGAAVERRHPLELRLQLLAILAQVQRFRPVIVENIPVDARVGRQILEALLRLELDIELNRLPQSLAIGVPAAPGPQIDDLPGHDHHHDSQERRQEADEIRDGRVADDLHHGVEQHGENQARHRFEIGDNQEP
nr:hypothetical protein Iba_chr08bCG2580 [Ipomoea batatas]